MAAEELVDVAREGRPGPWPSPVWPRIMPDPSSRTHDPAVGVKGVGAHDQNDAPGTAAGPGGLASSEVQVRGPLAHAEGLGQAVGDVGKTPMKLRGRRRRRRSTPGSPIPKTPT